MLETRYDEGCRKSIQGCFVLCLLVLTASCDHRLKELKSKQQLAVAEIQSQSIQKERDLLTVLYRAENEPGFNIHEAIEQLGLDLNLQQVEEHVKAFTERLCAQSKSITTPELPYAPPDS
eukprot:1528106-Rhodomonas_salina.1